MAPTLEGQEPDTVSNPLLSPEWVREIGGALATIATGATFYIGYKRKQRKKGCKV